MALVTERPRAPVDKTRDATGKYSFRSSRVVDVTPESGDTTPMPYADALTALTDYGIDFQESLDTDFPNAVVTGVTSNYNVVAGMWTFTATYGDGNVGGWTAQPPTVKFEPYPYTQAVDHSIDGIPYQNTAGTPFDPPMTRELYGVMVTVRVPVVDYDITTFLAYAGKVNSVALVLPGTYTIPIGMARFIPPGMAFRSLSAENAFVDLKFDCRPTGWKWNVVDAGAEGWGEDDASKPVRGLITTDAAGGSPSGQVRLDGTGVPMDPVTFSQIVTIDGGGTRYAVAGPPVASPSAAAVSPLVADGGLSTYDPLGMSTEGLVVLSFKQYEEADLNDLL